MEKGGSAVKVGKPGTIAPPESVACLGNTGYLDLSGALNYLFPVRV